MIADLFKKKVPQLLGLDIGSRYVKAVLLSKEGEQYVLQDFACEAITGNAFVEREIKDFEPVSNALKKIKKSLKIKKKPVAAGVSGTSVLTKVVYMDPGQTDHELEGQIEIEADSLIPYPLEEVYLDFEELGESMTHVGKVDVLLSAAHRDLVDSRITLLREVEFEPKLMDIEGYALGNAMSTFMPSTITNRDIYCCINIGASQLQITVIENDAVTYSKEHQFGSDMLVQDLAMMNGMDRDEIDRQLISGNLPEGWKEHNYPPFLANLQQSISRALQTYVSTTQKNRPEIIYLSGGIANLDGLSEDLSTDLSMTVELFDPFSEMKISEKALSKNIQDFAPQLAIAAGLASRGFNPWHL